MGGSEEGRGAEARAAEADGAGLLAGAVDLHVHGGPDVVARRHSDLELARRAKAAGMAAIVLKSHVESTVGRAAAASEASGFDVRGGIVLNPGACGGIDPEVVRTSLELGARVIWMPTTASAAHLERFPGAAPGAARPAARAAVLERGAARDICRLVAEAGALVASGHLGREETTVLAEEASAAGARLLLQHPDYSVPGLGAEAQAELAARFPTATFERCAFVASPGAPEPLPIERMVEAMQAVGLERNVVSSDLGQPANPPYPEGFVAFAAALESAGIARADLAPMLSTRAASLV
ncbi:MAG TPA: DUF6282 family protein [Solirubrobacterales bacterium]